MPELANRSDLSSVPICHRDQYRLCTFHLLDLFWNMEIWDNCQDYSKDKLEKINIEAARIVTGATKLVGLGSLYSEYGCEKLETRREQHKLTQLYKMLKGLTPEYLQVLSRLCTLKDTLVTPGTLIISQILTVELLTISIVFFLQPSVFGIISQTIKTWIISLHLKENLKLFITW